MRRFVVAVVVLVVSLVTACGGEPEDEGAATGMKSAPPGATDLCAAVKSEWITMASSGQPQARHVEFGGFSEASCSVGALSDNWLWMEFNRYGRDASGRTAGGICKQALDGRKARDEADWTHPSASPLPLTLGEHTEAQVRAIRYDVEVEILACRKADFVRVHYKAKGVDRARATADTERLTRKILEKFPRASE